MAKIPRVWIKQDVEQLQASPDSLTTSSDHRELGKNNRRVPTDKHRRGSAAFTQTEGQTNRPQRKRERHPG